MVPEIAALCAAALFLGGAMLIRRQIWLMFSVITYTATVCWIVQNDLGLLLPALGIAIVLGLAVLAMTICREVMSQDDTECNVTIKVERKTSQRGAKYRAIA
jgi:phosphotransferase system  glucose/maltose/N-acetylglucosamine-specific IIC component